MTAPLRLQILSDLRLEIERAVASENQEIYHYDVPVKAPVLCLLGDIGWTAQRELFSWLKKQLDKFEEVIFVSGNHGKLLTSTVVCRCVSDCQVAARTLLVFCRKLLLPKSRINQNVFCPDRV